MPTSVYSEIGKLRKVLVHKPGFEIENIAPEYLQDLLFEDIPFLNKIQFEHDTFVQVMRNEGVQVEYLLDLTEEAIAKGNAKEEFLEEFLSLSDIRNDYIKDAVRDFLLNLPIRQMLEKLVEGVKVSELKLKKENLALKVRSGMPFYLLPLPNLYFQRDPAAFVGKGVIISKMKSKARRRESLFMKYAIKYNPEFKDTPVYYLNGNFTIEGGDVIVLNENVLAIGISQRTEPEAVEEIAKTLFFESDESFDTILAFNLPRRRAYMHLDTVFTMVDYDKFLVHSKIEKVMNIFVLKKDGRNLKIIEEKYSLDEILKKYLGLDHVTLIKCGGDDEIAASREQWNDGSNCLALEPGVVIAYDRNYVTNNLLREAGVKVIEIPSSELSRGRGGPRCMSMPLFREKL